MVMTVTAPGFDTLVYARRLKEAGVDDAQAEAHAEAMRDAITESVATKADIARLEAKIDTGLAGLRAEIDTKHTDLKAEIDTGLAGLKAEIDTKYTDLKSEIDTGLAGLKAEIAASERRTMIAMLALAGVVVAIVTLLP